MPLTPIDIQQKTFGIALRGYDLDEVDDFLDEIVTSIKDYEMRLRDAHDRIADLEKEVADHSSAENAISRALLAAQRSADSIVEEARVDAERTVKGAETEAAQLLRAAEAEADQLNATRADERLRLRAEIEQMRSAIHQLRAQARVLAASIESDAAAVEEAAERAEREIESVGVDEPTDYRPVTAFHPPEPTLEEPAESLFRAAGVSVDPEPVAVQDEEIRTSMDEPAPWDRELLEKQEEPEPVAHLDQPIEEVEEVEDQDEGPDDWTDESDEWDLDGDGEPAVEKERVRTDQVADLPVIGEEPRPWLSDAIDIVEEGSEEWSGWSRTTKTDQRDDSPVTRPWERG